MPRCDCAFRTAVNPAQRQQLLHAARAPRRAGAPDAPHLARLLAAAFRTDPVMDFIARTGLRREAALERFFHNLLREMAIPLAEVWLSDPAVACAVWLPPGRPAGRDGFMAQLRLLSMFGRLCGPARLARGRAVARAMRAHHPQQPHYYLAFLAVAPRLQGVGLGTTLLEATLKGVDAAGGAAYLENSNPRNTQLYLRAGFVDRGDIAPKGAPSLQAMWRTARGAGEERGAQGSSSLSQ